ncbi:TPA: tRNA threonylcarbamoyladenosine dehydratase [Candidatus Galligastranaerophilus faecipullorum]|nr:tRNA threonylcarbamoyladenosine dehydratase [Candidatus Galligastranaerophilus faecipullorum]
MSDMFSRNEMYWGEDFQEYLKSVHIALFGLGGVGGYALEALCRAGVGNVTIVDFDTVSKSNINRQILALNSTAGQKKTKAALERIKDINPDINVRVFDDFYDGSQNDEIFSCGVDFTVDAIDTLRAKIGLLKYCRENNINVVTSLGAGNRLDASKLVLTDISQIKSNCSFIKNVLLRLKKEGIETNLPVVWSMERPKSLKKVKTVEKILKNSGEEIEITKFTPASTPVVPALSGLLCANYVINFLYCKFGSN